MQLGSSPPPTDFINVRFIDNLHLCYFVYKGAPIGFQIDTVSYLCRPQVRKISTCMGADKNGSVFTRQNTAIRCVAARSDIKLRVAVAPVKVTFNLRTLYPDRTQLISIFNGVVSLCSVRHLLLPQCSCFFGLAAFFFQACLLGRCILTGGLLLRCRLSRRASRFFPLPGDLVGMQYQSAGYARTYRQ